MNSWTQEETEALEERSITFIYYILFFAVYKYFFADILRDSKNQIQANLLAIFGFQEKPLSVGEFEQSDSPMIETVHFVGKIVVLYFFQSIAEETRKKKEKAHHPRLQFKKSKTTYTIFHFILIQ